ncbi:hypothetical protein FSST1_009753 [Fusarium sambucinum]
MSSQKRSAHQPGKLPNFEIESDGDQNDSRSDDSISDSDTSSDDHLPIAFRYTQTMDGTKYEIIHLDVDGTCRTVMENPENYPLQ